MYVNWCFMCKGDEESVNHVLLHCPVASELWNSIFSLFNLSWVMPGAVGFYSCVGHCMNIGEGTLFGRLFPWECARLFGGKEIEGLLNMRKGLFLF